MGILIFKVKEVKDIGEDWLEDRGVSEVWGEESMVIKVSVFFF